MMTLPTGSKRNKRYEMSHGGAFTLIELVLVMTILLIVFSVALPSLKGFFRGRNLDSEARRFLSLTRYGQSRAVSEGVSMVLWMDTRRGADFDGHRHTGGGGRFAHCGQSGRGRTTQNGGGAHRRASVE